MLNLMKILNWFMNRRAKMSLSTPFLPYAKYVVVSVKPIKERLIKELDKKIQVKTTYSIATLTKERMLNSHRCIPRFSR